MNSSACTNKANKRKDAKPNDCKKPPMKLKKVKKSLIEMVGGDERCRTIVGKRPT